MQQTSSPQAGARTQESEKLVTVYWIDKATGDCGCGEPVSRTEAEAFLAAVEPQWPNIQHWISEE